MSEERDVAPALQGFQQPSASFDAENAAREEQEVEAQLALLELLVSQERGRRRADDLAEARADRYAERYAKHRDQERRE